MRCRQGVAWASVALALQHQAASDHRQARLQLSAQAAQMSRGQADRIQTVPCLTQRDKDLCPAFGDSSRADTTDVANGFAQPFLDLVLTVFMAAQPFDV